MNPSGRVPNRARVSQSDRSAPPWLRERATAGEDPEKMDPQNDRKFGHIAIGVDNIYETCQSLQVRDVPAACINPAPVAAC